ncbi:peptidylprolyl isomerase [Blastochloris viridis]|uniref:Parvulin-like PPIase n=1 Tax=Blastochloris viridis TaxID=1079 RepID=A0A0H5BQ78_BLAVI|nr:peptidyl-prolyl cis-trans isomerase [Blastochloris viridis]ALK09637.1 Peptidyl-prolyl cis-trans isomerase D [Blastochloris viridis]BAS00474.1 putative PpiC-type peptidyl-prolyl cis-trans isomerase precursor associated with VreARI signaling system [Blastochloris viridis]CUU42300.1 Peptidyl-prolyl cis-trans isomerase D [Blastochloris viridis]
MMSMFQCIFLPSAALLVMAGPALAQTTPKPAPVPKPLSGQAAAAPTPLAPAGDVVARIGGIDVKASEIRALFTGLGPREQAALASDPTLASQTVRLMLANQLALKEALAKKWDQKPEVVDQLRQVREAAIVETYLASVAKVPAEFPSEPDIRSVYEANKTALVVPRAFEVSQIFVAAARDSDKAVLETARKKVTEIQAKLKQPGTDFAAVAESDSDVRTAEGGGALGWITETQVRPELRTILLGLSKGVVADPVQLDDGWHILKLTDTRPAAPVPFEDVRDQLEKRMRDERSVQLRRAYLGELLKKSPPAINELELNKVLGEVLPKPAKP